MRIYADESGTQGNDWLVIGMLFVPDHALLHSDLCAIKDRLGYLNQSKRHTTAKYKETHLNQFGSQRDLALAKAWIDRFIVSRSVFRSVVVDWSLYQGKYFGDPFEPEALKRRRAYKKWAELLLQPEVAGVNGATFYLDRLRVAYGYDVVDHLRERFTRNYLGGSPRIKEFQATESWKDANQCLQLCDLLVGCIYQKLVPSTNTVKLATRDYLYAALAPHGVKERSVGFWRGFAGSSLRERFPKFSEWYWSPKKKT